MELHLADHALALVLIVLLPVTGVYDFRRLRRAIGAGRASARTRAYLKVILEQWLVVAAVVLVWAWSERSWLDLGLVPASVAPWRLLVGTAAALLAVGMLELQRRQIAGDAEARAAVREQLDSILPLMPHNQSERRWFRAVSVTAGTCEELLYRGYLLAYLAPTMPLAAAVVVASIVFGCGHAYQGIGGVLKTSVVGLALCGLYILTGSLWIPMLIHVAVDWINGGIAGSLVEGPERLRV